MAGCLCRNKSSMRFSLSDFNYELPPERIAQAPVAERSASRLLVLDGAVRTQAVMRDFPRWLRAGDVLVVNDTRVVQARFFGVKEGSGGQVEVLVERALGGQEALAQVRASKSPRAGMRLLLAEGAFAVEVLGREEPFFRLRFPDSAPFEHWLERYGKLPLPPYIERAADGQDGERYQTVFARESGSVAAPTAGLHFDAPLLEAIRAKGVALARVTLHVGAGTFQPVRTENLDEHVMHSERFFVPQETVDAIAAARAAGGRVVAVGTTSLRALESAAASGELAAGGGETQLFITPGYHFRVVDALLTNFHLPRSTLLMLVSAFAGMEAIRAAYAEAIASGMRFFSYGDAMFIAYRSDSDAV